MASVPLAIRRRSAARRMPNKSMLFIRISMLFLRDRILTERPLPNAGWPRRSSFGVTRHTLVAPKRLQPVTPVSKVG